MQSPLGKRAWLVGVLLFTTLATVGCHSRKVPQNPRPSIALLSPNTAPVGGADFALTVSGSGFTTGSVVSWEGTARPTTFVDSTQLTAGITAHDIATVATASVTVSTPAPGGGVSDPSTFTITPANNPFPAIGALMPGTAIAAGPAFLLTVNGSNFVQGSTVNWNASPRTTTYTSSSQITASIAAADIETVGTFQVSVSNPAPGGGTSAAVAFPVSLAPNPVPTISALSPTAATQGGAAFSLIVNGTNFVSTSIVLWNASPRPTALINGTQLMAQISEIDIAAGGGAAITVNNAALGGGTSNSVTFAITPSSQRVGVVQLLTSATDGATGNRASIYAAISASGDYVAFSSFATNLVTADLAGRSGIFHRATCALASTPPGCVTKTILESVTTAGAQLASGSTAALAGNFMSSDGRYVVFNAALADVQPNPPSPNATAILLRDTCTGQSSGCAPSTSVVSLDDKNQPIASVQDASISGNGRIIVFSTLDASVLTGVPASPLLYARDTCFNAPAGPVCVPKTFLVSADNQGNPANSSFTTTGESQSDDGRYVAFHSDATNLVSGDTNNTLDVFVRDTCIGASSACQPSTVLVSANAAGHPATGGSQGSWVPSISGDGRFVMFQSDATDLVGTNNQGVLQIYLRDTCLGVSSACTPTTTLLTKGADGSALTGASTLEGNHGVSATGRFLLFDAGAPLNAGDHYAQTYVLDTCFGALNCVPSNHVVSVNAQAVQNSIYGAVALSSDGSFAVLRNGDSLSQLYLAKTGF